MNKEIEEAINRLNNYKNYAVSEQLDEKWKLKQSIEIVLNCIKELEQNNYEQAEEKEVYINKCKMYEELLKANGLIDECECR